MSFGLLDKGDIDYVELVLQSADRVDNIFSAKFALYDAYLANTGMYNMYDISKNRDSVHKPLSIISKHKANTRTNALWRLKVEQFGKSAVYETFGISMEEAFKMPMWKLNEILEIAERLQKEKSNTINRLQKDLDNLNKGKV